MAGEREALVRRACDTIEPPVELACSYPECRCEKAGTVGRVAVVLVDAGWRPPPESQAAGELPWDRDQLGRFVREAWVRWAQTQPVPKPSWLIPYDDLAEADKEVDRQIGEAIARWTIIGQNAKHAILLQAGMQFRHYELLHRQKGNEDKAAINGRWASLCESAALTPAGGDDGR